MNAPLRKEISRNLGKAEGLRKEILAFSGAKKPKLAKITRAPLLYIWGWGAPPEGQSGARLARNLRW